MLPDTPQIDPLAQPREPLPAVRGVSFAYQGGCCVLVAGPTGSGRSALLEAVLYDPVNSAIASVTVSTTGRARAGQP